MPRSRFDELVALADEHDGLLTAEQAREAGVTDSVLTRLVQRGRLERTARGVFRIPYFQPDRFSQYREAVLSVKANRGPNDAALSHTTALAVYGISDVNPSLIHLTVPRSARLRRQMPKGVVLHREDLAPEDVAVEEGIPITTISRTVIDLLHSGGRIDLIRQAISDARRDGLIRNDEAKQLRRRVEARLKMLREQEQKEPGTA
jgi:predicted transcriptional regulator of viral defense system